jgi:Flp pilus assembly protein TadG
MRTIQAFARNFRLRLGAFGEATGAAAAVEFALVLPFMLLLLMGSIEASSLITVDRRVNVISGTVGDLVARWDPDDGAIPSGTLTDYFTASAGIIFPYETDDLEQVVSFVEVLSDGTTKVLWSCGHNGGTKRTTNATYPTLPANINLLARPPTGEGFVVASETSYNYVPVLGIVFEAGLDLYQESFYLPRHQETIAGPSC